MINQNLKKFFYTFLFISISSSSILAQDFDPSSVRSADCTPGVYQCGYLPSPKEIQDSIPIERSFRNFDELPTSVDLSSKMPPVGSQGRQNSCVAWATGYAIKSYLAKNNGVTSNYDPPFSGGNGKNVFSPAFIYNQQNGGKDAGLYYYKTMEFLQKSGVAPWSSMPYSDKDYKKQPTAAAKKEALEYRIKSYSRINHKNPDDIKRVLASGNVALVGVIIDDGFYNLKGAEVYDANSGKSYGGHAMTIVGYDDSKASKSGKKGAFKLQNSWGTNWGDKGFGWISYSMLAKVGQESYSMVDSEKPNSTSTNISTPTTPTVTKIPFSPPAEILASRGDFSDKIILTWKASEGAIAYLIQRKMDGEDFQDLMYSSTTSITDSNVSPSTTYFYRIVSVSSTEASPASTEIEGYTLEKTNNNGKLGQVVGLTGTSFLDGSAKVELSWSEMDGATGYTISKMEPSKKWKNIGKATSNSFIDSSPSLEDANIYRVAANSKAGKIEDWSDSISIDVGTEKESLEGKINDLTASDGEYTDKIELKWSALPGATGYYIFRFDQDANLSGEFTTESIKYEDKDKAVTNGDYFSYAIYAYNEIGYSEQSEFVIGRADPELSKRAAGVTLSPPLKVTSEIISKENKIKLKWSSVKDSFEYYIYRKKMNPKSGSTSKFQFVTSVSSKINSYSESFPGNPGELFLYTIRSKSEFGSESKDSQIVSVFLNQKPSQIKKRAMSLEEIPKSFTGSWTGFYWHPKSGPTSLVLEIIGQNQDFNALLKINDKITKQYKGSWTPGSTGIKTDGFQLDLSKDIPGDSLVKINGILELGEDIVYSFSKD